MSHVTEAGLTVTSIHPVLEAKHKFFFVDIIAYKKTVQLHVHPTEATNRVLFEEAIAATIDAFHPNIRLSRCPHSRCPILILGLEGIQRIELSQILGTIARNYKDGGSDSKPDNGNDGPSGAVGNTNDNKGAE